MSNEVVKLNTQGLQWTPEQTKLIMDTLCRGATPDEAKLFFYRAKTMGLDPLKPGQIHFVKYGSGPGSIVIGIEGFRSIAGRTGKLSGVKRGVLKDEQGKLIGGWAEIYRSDWTHSAREEVPFAEYNTGKAAWAKMPETMIKKVAEAAALRMAFPDDLGGVYESAEMDQADTSGKVLPEQPSPEEGVQTQEYVIPYGPCAKQTVWAADPEKLKEFILGREESYRKSGRPHGAWFLELLKQAEPIIGAHENREPGAGE